MASSIIQEFNIKIGITFYDIDIKVIDALQLSIEAKEREKVVHALTKGGLHPPRHMIEDEDSNSLSQQAAHALEIQRAMQEPIIAPEQSPIIEKRRKTMYTEGNMEQ